ncbi:MAG: protein-methionine-sulfoxide reductase catalytic subunit MsrP [Geminicoccaceae bacterium]|nr:protein-methionine-sulfoxide reductase catalytic subunit MsrP [Geminicoccaceae bacterium]HRY23352.1 protein-methionine-sulfoxide reductase catalytic subunit MsrP [Geminicoccaceae bacterium]
MLLPSRRPRWKLAESLVTDERLAFGRRRLIGGMAAAAGLAVAGCKEEASQAVAATEAAAPADPSAALYPAARNAAFDLPEPWTPERLAAGYNNFIEFGSHKNIQRAAQALPTRPWTVTVDGLVAEPMTIDIDDLLRRMPLEERVYRHRCVETWAMIVPWSGFALRHLLDLAEPLASARYVLFQTFEDSAVAPGQRAFWYPWPYTEAVTLAEAGNDLAFMVTGLYGKPLPRQNGAPLRLALPWKYGYKSIKSIERISLVEERPDTFWNVVDGNEYGFWANVNPAVPHPRWSQATERLLGTQEDVPTLLFNGYAEEVAGLYPNLMDKSLYR